MARCSRPSVTGTEWRLWTPSISIKPPARRHGLATNSRKQKHIGQRKDNALTISSSTTRSGTPALSWTCACEPMTLCLTSDHRPQIMYLDRHRARPSARRLPRSTKTATLVVVVRWNLGSKRWLEEPGPDGHISKGIYQAELAAKLDALVSEEILAATNLTELAATIKTTITTCAQLHLCPKQRAPARN